MVHIIKRIMMHTCTLAWARCAHLAVLWTVTYQSLHTIIRTKAHTPTHINFYTLIIILLLTWTLTLLQSLCFFVYQLCFVNLVEYIWTYTHKCIYLVDRNNYTLIFAPITLFSCPRVVGWVLWQRKYRFFLPSIWGLSRGGGQQGELEQMLKSRSIPSISYSATELYFFFSPSLGPSS